MNNKSFFVVHRWIGLNCGLVLFVICLSGTVATLSEEMDWLINPALRATPRGSPLPWGELQERVQSQHPDVSVRAIQAPRNRRTAAFVEVESETGRKATLLVDPYSGNVQGVHSFHCVKVLFRVFHKQFYIFGYPKGIHGIYLVGVYGFFLLAAGLTGLLVYKRFWARLFVLRLRHGRDVFWRDAHRLLGVWTSLLLLVWSITGVWYFAERILTQTKIITSSPNLPIGWKWDDPAQRTPASVPTVSELAIEDYLRIARQEFPELDVTAIQLPRQAGGPAMVAGSTRALLVRENSSQLLIDSLTGEILDRRMAEEMGPLDRWTVTSDPLHFGTFGGLPTKILWFVLGLGVSTLIPVGATIWYRRASRSADGQRSASTGAKRSRTTKLISVFVNGTILVVAMAYTYAMSPPRLEEPKPPQVVAEIGMVTIGPWTAELARIGPAEPKRQAAFRIRFPESSLPNVQRVALDLGDQTAEFSGTWNFHHAKLRIPEESNKAQELTLVLEGRDGVVHRHRFAPSEWKKPGEMKEASVPPAEASPFVTAIFLAFFVFIGLFASIWFWRIG